MFNPLRHWSPTPARRKASPSQPRRPIIGIALPPDWRGLEPLESRVMLTASPYATAAFTPLPGVPTILAGQEQTAINEPAMDLNGDHLADLLVQYDTTGSDSQRVATTIASLVGQPDGTFTQHVIATFNAPDTVDQVSINDLNKDGRPDVIVASTPDDSNPLAVQIDVYLCNSDGTYTKTNQSFNVDTTGFDSTELLNVFDMNGDGKLDLVLAEQFATPAIMVFRGSGNGTFLDPVTTTFQNISINIFDSDVSGDGITDVIGSGFDSLTQKTTISVFKGQADGSYNLTPVFTDNTHNYIVPSDALQQLSSDNNLDMVVYTNSVDATSVTWSVLRNNGDGTFTQSFTETIDGSFDDFTAADLNNDGVNDLILTSFQFTDGTDTTINHIEKNNGSGVFTDVQQITARSLTPSVDIDHDGLPDLIAYGHDQDSNLNSITFYFNQGNTTFTDPGVTLTPAQNTSLVGFPEDVNGDGKFDALFYFFGNADSTTYSTSAFENLTGRTFGPEVVSPLQGPGSVVATDLNGDGDLDLVDFAPDGSSFTFYAGNADGAFTPADTSVSFGGNAIDPTNFGGVYPVINYDNNASPDLFFISTTAPGILVSINSSSGVPADNAGNTRQTARDIGALSDLQTFHDAVNPSDTDDFYKFTLAQSAGVTIGLTGLSANANIQLLNSSGGTIDSGSLAGSADESLTDDLAAGTYYIRVFSVSGSSTNYTLTAAAVATAPILAVSVGDSPITSGQDNPVDFGTVVQGQTSPHETFTFSNTGDATLVLSPPSLPDHYTIVSSDHLTGGQLAAGDTAHLTVALDTSNPGTFTDAITFTNNSDNTQNTFSLPITGIVTPAPILLPDLTGAITDVLFNGHTITPDDLLVPGDKITVNLTITNGGPGVVNAQNVDVDIAASTGAAPPVTFGQSFNIPKLQLTAVGSPTDAKSFQFVLTVPTDALAGSYLISAVVDGTGVVDESNESNNTVTSGLPATVVLEAGQVGARSNVPLVFDDGNGTPVTLTLTSSGTATVELVGGVVNLQITGTTPKSVFTLKTKTGSPQVQLQNVTIGTPVETPQFSAFATRANAAPADAAPVSLKSFSAANGVLVGTFEVNGIIQNIQIGEVNGGTIKIDTPAAGVTVAPLVLSFPLDIHNGSIISAIPIKSLTTVAWTDDDDTPDVLSAPSIATLTVSGSKSKGNVVAGDFQADVTGLDGGDTTLTTAKIAGSLSGATWNLTGAAPTIQVGGDLGDALNPVVINAVAIKSLKVGGDFDHGTLQLSQAVDPKLTALGTLTVTGTFTHSTIASAGVVNAVTVGAMDNSQLLIDNGGLPGLVADPSVFADHPVKPTLASLTIKGLAKDQTSLSSSVIDAWNIGKASLKLVDDAPETSPFGFAADKIGALSFQAVDFNSGKPMTLKTLDTTADLSDPKKNSSGVLFPIGSFTVNLL